MSEGQPRPLAVPPNTSNNSPRQRSSNNARRCLVEKTPWTYTFDNDCDIRIFLRAELASRVLNPRIESLRMEFKTNLRNAQGALRPTAVNGPYRAGSFRGDLTQGVALG